MNYQKCASEIIKNIGGKDNISHLEHCSTRLRFTLYDNSKVNIESLEKIDGVLGVRQNVQTQIIIGNEVNEVYDQVASLVGDINENGSSTAKKKQNYGAIFLDFLVSIFQPLVPAIAGGGVLKSLLLLLQLFGWVNSNSDVYKIFMQIGDAPLYFLPLLVAFTTAQKLKVNPLVAVSAVSALILPNITALIVDKAHLFGFVIQNIAYPYQVFSAILTVLFYAVMEKVWTKYTPKPIRIFFVPMMSLAITVPISLLILGPLGYNFGQLFAAVIIGIHSKLGFVATGLLAAILPLMVAAGMHKAMLPYAISTFSKLGSEALYLPASLAHNISESGASFAVAIRTKDEKLRATAISAGISALFGITEPALYGVTLQHKKVLYSVIASSFIGGAFIGIAGINAFALVGPGLASMTMYVDPNNSKNLMFAIIAFVISIVLSFVFTLIFYKEEVDDVMSDEKAEGKVSFYSPVNGEYLPLEQVNDDVFALKMVGEGIAIEPKDGNLYSPVDGEVMMVYDTGHALALKSTNGAEILFHIGLDTVKLNGEGFYPQVETGAIVNKGDLLVRFDLDNIKDKGFDTTVMAVVTNKNDYNIEITKNLSELNNDKITMNITKGAVANG